VISVRVHSDSDRAVRGLSSRVTDGAFSLEQGENDGTGGYNGGSLRQAEPLA